MKLIVLALMVAAQSGSALAGPTAEELYGQGQSAYDRGDYTAAIVKWRTSYELSSASGLLFNLAQAYRLSGDCKQALSTYRQFILTDPTADKRPLADEFVSELDPSCGAPTKAPIVDHPIAKPGRTMKLVGLATGGAGLVLFATGVYFGHRASTLGDEVTHECSIPAMPCNWSVEKDKDVAGRRDAAIGYALDAIGVAAIAGGAALYYFGDREAEMHAVSIVVQPHQDGAVLSWSGSW